MEGSLAATSPAAQKFVENISGYIVNPLIILLFTFALVAFLWGVRGYIAKSDNPEARGLGANQIMWGIIGMAIMLMSFTVVRIVLNTFGLSKDAPEVEKVIGR